MNPKILPIAEYETFFSWDFQNSISPFTTDWSSDTYWRALEVGEVCSLTMCVAAALAKAIGIVAESTKCAGRSEAGLAAIARAVGIAQIQTIFGELMAQAEAICQVPVRCNKVKLNISD